MLKEEEQRKGMTDTATASPEKPPNAGLGLTVGQARIIFHFSSVYLQCPRLEKKRNLQSLLM